MADRAKTIDRLQKLRRMTVANGCTPNEAEVAAQRVSALEQELGIEPGADPTRKGSRFGQAQGSSHNYSYADVHEYGSQRRAGTDGRTYDPWAGVRVDWSDVFTGNYNCRSSSVPPAGEALKRAADNAVDAFRKFAEKFTAAYKMQQEYDAAIKAFDDLMRQAGGRGSRTVSRRTVDFTSAGKLKVTEHMSDGSVRSYTDFKDVVGDL